MEKFEWENATSYAQGEQDRTPRTWKVRNGDLVITVTRRHRLEGWFLVCNKLGIDIDLEASEVEDAKREALIVVGQHLDDLSKRFRDLVIGAG